jgi:hypothetical protein
MKITASSPEEYIQMLQEPARSAVAALRDAVRRGIPSGFMETMQYGMITWVVPHAIYPAGYRANPKDPLPFLSIAAQKNHIALYHMGLYAFPEHLAWFEDAYRRAGVGRLDMGKSCVRFARADKIPFGLIEELAGRISVDAYIRKVSEA